MQPDRSGCRGHGLRGVQFAAARRSRGARRCRNSPCEPTRPARNVAIKLLDEGVQPGLASPGLLVDAPVPRVRIQPQQVVSCFALVDKAENVFVGRRITGVHEEGSLFDTPAKSLNHSVGLLLVQLAVQPLALTSRRTGRGTGDAGSTGAAGGNGAAGGTGAAGCPCTMLQYDRPALNGLEKLFDQLTERALVTKCLLVNRPESILVLLDQVVSRLTLEPAGRSDNR